jgi:hypothetical protein
LETQATLWHYLVAPPVLAVLGTLWHLARAFWAPYPERVISSKFIDTHLPFGYLITDWIHETEFDEDGYYRIDGWRNLKVAVSLAVAVGMFFILLSPAVASFFASCVNAMFQWLFDLAAYRWQNL